MTSIRIGTSKNLEDGGTFDILIMGFPNGFPRGYVSFEMGDTPRRVTGVQKVVQTFLYNLLSTKGSDPIRPKTGTSLPSYIYSSNIGSNLDELKAIVRNFVREAEKQTIKILSSRNNDKSSQLRSIEVTFINASDDSISLGLRVVTMAGEQASIAIPFPQVDLAITG